MLYEVIHALTPVATDSTGFQVFVEEAQIAFIPAPVIKRWAAEGGAVRRRQEIPDEDMIVGRLPKGKLISLSHCWDATDNCDPTGEKMRDLAQALEDLDATGEEDGARTHRTCGASLLTDPASHSLSPVRRRLH